MTDAATTLGDPVRAQVEATLRRVAADVTALPCQVVRCVQRRVEEPVAVVRTVVSLAVGTMLGRSPLGVGTVAPAGDDTAPPPLTGRAFTDGDGDVAGGAPPGHASADLPIEDYENLAASQVVARLERLGPDQLELIETFEAAHRGRRTIIGKIEQLRAGR